MEKTLDNLRLVFVNMILNYLASNAAGFLWGPVGVFIRFIIGWVMSLAMKEVAVGGLFLWLDFKNKKSLNAVETALSNIINFQGQMTLAEVADYEQKLVNSYFELVEFRLKSGLSVPKAFTRRTLVRKATDL